MRPTCAVLCQTLLLLGGLRSAAAWSFRTFLEGQWDLERMSGSGTVDVAHYSLQAVGDTLEGTYSEDGSAGPENTMRVRVVFHDASGLTGEFQLARQKLPEPTQSVDDEAAAAPEPVPAAEPKTVFEFAFREQSGGRFHLSESNWLAKSGGSVQFLVSDDDAFVFTKVSGNAAASSGGLSSWTASRRGSKPGRRSGPRSMLSKYGWYVAVGMVWSGYRFATRKLKVA